MDRSPPQFFNQGPSAHARLAFFAALAIALLVIDSRLGSLEALRHGVGTMLYPLQRALLMPGELASGFSGRLQDIEALRLENNELRRIETVNAQALLRAETMAAENAQLRELLGARERVAMRSVFTEVLYESRDPYTRKLVIDRGVQHGVLAGQPVIDAHGVLGQVTRALPLSSEVTLLTDSKAAIPVEVRRTGQRMIAFGGRSADSLELRFVSAGSDLQPGDELITSGLDGVYPAGIVVGAVTQIESGRLSESTARVILRPSAGMERSRMALVLLVDRGALPQLPLPEKPAAGRRRQTAE